MDSNKRVAVMITVDMRGRPVAFCNTHWTYVNGDLQVTTLVSLFV